MGKKSAPPPVVAENPMLKQVEANLGLERAADPLISKYLSGQISSKELFGSSSPDVYETGFVKQGSEYDQLRSSPRPPSPTAGDPPQLAAQKRFNQKLWDEAQQTEKRLVSSGTDAAAVRRAASMDPFAGSRLATEEVQANPILGQLFGKGGALERTLREEQELASRGYSLQPEDYEAYGQASGDIARLFGTQEQDLAQQLASRGLASAPNGIAGQQYSGLLGNKHEQLARAQTDIAQRRMHTNLERLGQTRNLMTNLGSLGNTSINDQFNRQLAGTNQYQNNLRLSAGLKEQSNASINNANIQRYEQEQANQGFGLGDALGLGASAGLMGATGGLFGAAGSHVANKIFTPQTKK